MLYSVEPGNRSPEFKMASKGTKGFVAILVVIAGLLIVNFTIIDIPSAVGKVWTSTAKNYDGKQTGNHTKDKHCGTVIPSGECKECLNFQLANLDKYPECKETSKRQRATCSKSKTDVYISCRINEEKKFWIFQISALVLGCLSSLVVWCRSKHLDEHILEKIKKQIGSDS